MFAKLNAAEKNSLAFACTQARNKRVLEYLLSRVDTLPGVSKKCNVVYRWDSQARLDRPVVNGRPFANVQDACDWFQHVAEVFSIDITSLKTRYGFQVFQRKEVCK